MPASRYGAAMYRVAVFARRPVAGQVKTRLSPSLPPEMALALYRAMLADTLAEVGALDAFERVLYWTGDGPTPAAPAGFVVREQKGADLGERLERAFDELLADSGDRAAVVGSDCPGLTAGLVRSAFAALATNPLVLGPASDGGYWLVALRKRTPAIFRGIPWGTGGVMSQTMDRASRSGLAVNRLDMLDDLDTPDDLARLVAAALQRPDACGRWVRETLREMALLPA